MLRFGLLAFLSPCVPAAWSCDLPVPFDYVYQNNVSSSVVGTSCALTVNTTAASRTTAAAFFHYRRATSLTSVRYGFRLDTSALLSGLANQQVRLFSATSPIVALSPPTSDVLHIDLRLGTTPSLLFFAGDAAVASSSAGAFATLSGTVNTIRVEITVGTPGTVKYWINHTFTDPPDGNVEGTPGGGLQNAALLGVSGAEIGLSSTTRQFRDQHAGEALVFDQIESTDDVVFYDDFSSGAQ